MKRPCNPVIAELEGRKEEIPATESVLPENKQSTEKWSDVETPPSTLIGAAMLRDNSNINVLIKHSCV